MPRTETNPSKSAWDSRGFLAGRIEDSLEVRRRMLEDRELQATVARATEVLVEATRRRSTVFFFGNGGSSADAGHLAAELLGRFYCDRPPLGAVALADATAVVTAVANDYSYDEVFSRQLAGLGRQGDVAVGLTTSGNSLNVVRALETAKTLGITTVVLTGEAGGKVADVAELVIKVPSSDTPRIQECHVLIGHTMCEAVELALFPDR